MPGYQLSKSSFVRSVQCLKSFHLYKHHYYLKDPISKDKQAIFNRGIDVGKIAQHLFPGGIDVSPSSVREFDQSVERTKQLIDSGSEIIYEAAFIFNEVLVAVDLLVKENNLWYAYEVKSSLKISGAYVLDASLQYYVIKNCLPDLKDFFIVTLNTDYILEDELNIQELFRKKSVLFDVKRNLQFIENRINAAKSIIENPKIPDIKIGAQCFKPYVCDFFGSCWKNIPEKNIFSLNSLGIEKQLELYNEGIIEIKDIDNFNGISDILQKQIKSFQQQTVINDTDKITAFFNQIKFPITFFDIELYTPAVPVFKGTKPYQQLPFLFSVHQLKTDNVDLTHDFFYAAPGSDPREEFVLACIEKLKNVETIIVFDDNLERNVINALIKHFPHHQAALEQIRNKLYDIAPIFTQMHYFDPSCIGSFTLKNLYTKITGDNLFDQLQVSSGTQASYTYNALQTEENELIKKTTEQELIVYCKADTFACAQLFLHLKNPLK